MGKSVDRLLSAAALDHARKGDTVMVWKLERLAGSPKRPIETAQVLEACGIAFKSVMETIDMTGLGGNPACTVFAGLAEGGSYTERASFEEMKGWGQDCENVTICQPIP